MEDSLILDRQVGRGLQRDFLYLVQLVCYGFPPRIVNCSAIVGQPHTIIYLPASQLPAQVQWIFRSTAGRRLLVSFFRSTRHQGLEGHPLCNQQQQQQHPAHTAPVFVLMLRYIT